MIRKQISLEPEQDSGLKREAARRGISESAVIRELIDDLLARTHEDKWAVVDEIEGRYRSGFHDIAENHDFYLYGPDVRE